MAVNVFQEKSSNLGSGLSGKVTDIVIHTNFQDQNKDKISDRQSHLVLRAGTKLFSKWKELRVLPPYF